MLQKLLKQILELILQIDKAVEIKRSGQCVFTNKSPFSCSLQINNTASVSVHLPSNLCECGCENKDLKRS